MAVTVADIAREVVALLGQDSGYELAAQWVARRYQQLCAEAKFRHLRKVGQLYLPAPVSSGTFTVTMGSDIVTADATATTALSAVKGAPQVLEGQWWRIAQGSVWYRISQVITGSTWSLVLETPYATDNNQAGIFAGGPTQSNLTYYVIPRFVEVAPDARQIGTMVIDAMYRPLEQKSEDELNWLFANRFLIAYPPFYYAVVGSALSDTDQPKVVEFYPWPQSSTTIHYTYWTHPPVLGLYDLVPPTIDRDILKTGAMADAYFNESSRLIRAGKLQEGVSFRNFGNQEETKFDAKMARAIRNDRGVDDVKLILRRMQQRPIDFDPVQTAEENFYARGI